MKYSIIVPVYNEEGNIFLLFNEIKLVMDKLKSTYEVIFIDDGSKDSSYSKMFELSKKNKEVRIIRFRRNFGQTAAMDAGIKNAKGDILITMDADLQNDPRDIPKLLSLLDKDYDVVCGWRKNRKDPISKKLFSKIANAIRKSLTKEKIHDSGCTLKVYRKECFNNITLYGEMHRYIPAILQYKGYKIGEAVVNHRARKYGKTKYGFGRVFKGLFDLLFIKFWNDYSTRPIHFFGSLAVAQFFIAIAILIQQIVKAIMIGALYLGPLLVLSVLFVITGFLTFIFGFLAEIMIRMYYQDKPNYEIENII